MRGIKLFGLSMVLMSVTACAPVVYDANYSRQRTPSSHVTVHTTHTQPSQRYVRVYQQINPIEVTLYADKSYMGVYFNPVNLIISDGQYVEIPVRNRRGQLSRIYAHYYQRDLHFDSDKNCRNIHGSSRYKYDKKWDKGYKYSYINAGNNYDLSGLRLQVRNLPPGQYQAMKNRPVKTVNKKVIVHNNHQKEHVKQQVIKVVPKNNNKRVVIHENQYTNNGHAVKVSDYYVKDKQDHKAKVVVTKDKSPKKGYENTVKTVKRPVIVEKINRHEQSRRAVNVPAKPAEKKKVVVHKSNDKAEKVVTKQNRRPAKEVVSKERKDQQREKSIQKTSVKVSLAGGTMTVDGKQGKLTRKNLTLKDGESRNVTLIAKGGIKVNVPISYRNGTLRVAQSNNQFKSNASWAKGKTYKISTQGSSHLDDVQVTVVTL